MTAQEWRRVKEVFDVAVETDPSDREAFISRVCAGELAIEREVRRMVAAAATTGVLDEAPVEPSALARILLALESPIEVGQTIAERFRIVRFLGSGGMGDVWEAFDTQLQESVAVKTVRMAGALDPAVIARFKSEVQRARQVAHPNVCRVYDLFFHETVPFLTMELLTGETLAERLAREGSIAPSAALRILSECADAVGGAHAVGIVHRDLKPANVMLTAGGRTVVMDFGIARPIGQEFGPPVTAAGTPAYMAPEQAVGANATTASDVYSFAVLVCEVLTGKRPAEGGMELLPPDWSAAVHRGLAVEPASRPPSARTLLQSVNPRHWKRIVSLWAALALLTSALSAWYLAERSSSAKRSDPPSIAVLPFESANATQDSVSEALSSEIAASLSRRRELRVVARTSAGRFRNSVQDPAQIGKQLNARYLLTGSTHRDGDRLRVTVQLIEAAANAQIWAESYDRPAVEVLQVERQISRTVAAQLGVPIGPPPARQAVSAGSEAYLYGRFLLNRRDSDSVRLAIQHLTRATREAPQLAEAHAALAEALIVLAENGLEPFGPAIAQARTSANQARSLDPRLAEAHAILGFLAAAADHDFAAADREFLYAIDLNPALALGRQWYSYNLIRQRRFDEARTQALAAVNYDPLAMPAQQNLAGVYYYSRNWPALRPQCARLLELDPHHHLAHLMLAHAAALSGDFAEMERELKLAARNASVPMVYRRMAIEAYGFARQPAKAQPLLEVLLAPNSGSSPAFRAAALAAIGQTDDAFAAMEEAWREQDMFLSMLAVHPAFDSIRSDARYLEFIRRLGLPITTGTAPDSAPPR